MQSSRHLKLHVDKTFSHIHLNVWINLIIVAWLKILSVFVTRRLYLKYVSGQVKFKSLKCWEIILKHILVHYVCSRCFSFGFKPKFLAVTTTFRAWAPHIEKKLVSVEVCLWAYFLIKEPFARDTARYIHFDSLNGANFHNSELFMLNIGHACTLDILSFVFPPRFMNLFRYSFLLYN